MARGAVAGGAGDAGRDHAAAELVPVSPRQDLVLVAHRAGAASRADGAAADGAEPAPGLDRRTLSRTAGQRARLERAADRVAGRPWLCPPRPAVAAGRADLPRRPAAPGDREGRGLSHRT